MSDVAAGGELVHAIDARFELQAGDIDRLRLSSTCGDLERRAAALDLEPVARELRQALALELGEAAFEPHLLHGGCRRIARSRRPYRSSRAVEFFKTRPDLFISAWSSLPRSRASRPDSGSSSSSADRRQLAKARNGHAAWSAEHARAAAHLPGPRRAALCGPRRFRVSGQRKSGRGNRGIVQQFELALRQRPRSADWARGPGPCLSPARRTPPRRRRASSRR